MTAGHMKLFPAVLALVLTLADTFVHAHVDRVLGYEDAARSSVKGTCRVQRCAECKAGKPDTCKRCDDKYNASWDSKHSKEGVVTPARAAGVTLPACMLGTAMLAL